MLETILEELSGALKSVHGLSGDTLIALACIIAGYLLRIIKRFPNDAIPVVVILLGAVLYPIIADADNDTPLRTWIVQNICMGALIGFIAWVMHKTVLSRLEERLGLFGKTPES